MFRDPKSVVSPLVQTHSPKRDDAPKADKNSQLQIIQAAVDQATVAEYSAYDAHLQATGYKTMEAELEAFAQLTDKLFPVTVSAVTPSQTDAKSTDIPQSTSSQTTQPQMTLDSVEAKSAALETGISQRPSASSVAKLTPENAEVRLAALETDIPRPSRLNLDDEDACCDARNVFHTITCGFFVPRRGTDDRLKALLEPVESPSQVSIKSL